MALAAAAGAAAALGHAPFPDLSLATRPLVAVSFLGFAALFAVISRSDRPTLAGWAGGAAYFAVALHWIVEPFLVQPEVHGWMAPFGLVFMAGGLALFWAGGAWLAARLGGGPLVLAAGLTAAEVLRGHVFTGFPWALPAYIWVDWPMRHLAAWVGPYGLTALTLAGAAWLGTAVGRQAAARGAGVAVALLGVTGVVALPVAPDQGEDGARVLLVQPNAPQDEKWDPDLAAGFVRRQIALSQRASEGADLVVWPESAIPYPLDVAGPVFDAALDATGGTPVLMGLNRRDGDDWFNSLALVDPGGVQATYDKVHLVPFGEYIPFRIDILRAMAAFSNYGFSAGERVYLIDTPLGTALPMICYETIFPGHLRQAEGRPDYLLQITNDAWFGTFAGPYQHLDQARFRAVEQGLPLVRVANTGVSAVIDPEGRVTASIPLGVADSVVARLPQPNPPTLYARTGDWPVFSAIAALLVGAALRKRVAKRGRAS